MSAPREDAHLAGEALLHKAEGDRHVFGDGGPRKRDAHGDCHVLHERRVHAHLTKELGRCVRDGERLPPLLATT